MKIDLIKKKKKIHWRKYKFCLYRGEIVNFTRVNAQIEI